MNINPIDNDPIIGWRKRPVANLSGVDATYYDVDGGAVRPFFVADKSNPSTPPRPRKKPPICGRLTQPFRLGSGAAR